MHGTFYKPSTQSRWTHLAVDQAQQHRVHAALERDGCHLAAPDRLGSCRGIPRGLVPTAAAKAPASRQGQIGSRSPAVDDHEFVLALQYQHAAASGVA